MKKFFLTIIVSFIGAWWLGAQPTTLPNFKFNNAINGGAFTKTNLKQGLATIVILFSPDCEHCQQQAKWIREGASKFADNVQFMWVSFESNIELIRNFPNKFLSGVKAPMYFLHDPNLDFDKYFGNSEVPTILVYDSKGQLVKVFRTEVEVEKLLPLIK
ncbi:MAG: redoxin family protein [Bacteroidia bacterium]|nr:redoxin family protein [Bacteroidia bacterium]MDW8158885.1 redoxin family protein [Bacteroidia bacterium]